MVSVLASDGPLDAIAGQAGGDVAFWHCEVCVDLSEVGVFVDGDR